MRSVLALILSVLSLIGCATSSPAYSRDIALEVSPTRTLVLDQVVTGSSLAPLAKAMVDWATDGTGQPIDMVLSSPGGEVNSGFLFINLMEDVRARGIKLRCFVPTMAASMAFQILVHCDERYTLNRSLLLWHRVRVQLGGGLFGGGSALTGPMASDIAEDLKATDLVIFRELCAALSDDLEAPEVLHHFNRETLHIGESLGLLAPHFITSYPAIKGLMDAMKNTKLPHAAALGFELRFREGTIVYIYNQK